MKDTYSSWDDKTQQLNPVVGAVIAIAVGVATYGTATAASIGGMASNATIAAGEPLRGLRQRHQLRHKPVLLL
ncbi:hypothetical protein ACI8BE_018160 [Proteus mirabilis]